MDKEFQTSFIPKKPLNEEHIATRRPVSLINFVVTLIFIGSLVAAGGAYAYELSLKKSVADKNAQLELARDDFDPKVIEEMQLLDKRLKASNDILGNHIMISPIFQSLQELTLKTISYTKFTYEIKTEAGKKEVAVQMSGKGTNYDAIALQSDSLAENKYIKNPIFSNLNQDEKGRVTFDLSFTVDPSFINFADTINREGTELTEQDQAAVLEMLETTIENEQNAVIDTNTTGQQGIVDDIPSLPPSTTAGN